MPNYRYANESMQLEEAQTRYELNQIKVEVLQQLEDQQKCHDDRVKAINEVQYSNIAEILFMDLNPIGYCMKHLLACD